MDMRTMVQIRNVGIILIMLVSVACSNKQKKGPGMGMGLIKEYPVMTLQLQSAKLSKDYPVTLRGQQTVEIRSKITGYIEQIYVDEGAYVTKGQLLFRLNDNDLKAVVRSAEAQVKVAEADVYSAQINLEKNRPLVDKSIISKFELESAESTVKAKEAQLAQTRANLENARANLQYALITSPASGTIGTFPYRVGSLVSSTSADPLTTISNTVKMYAYFSMNEKEFLELASSLKGKNIQEKFTRLPDVLLLLADNSVYAHPGRIETASGLVDSKTGAVNIRADFPNPEGLLRSGGSGLVRIPHQVDSVIVIPQKATYELQGKHFVYILGSDNKVKSTEIDVLTGNLKETCVVSNGLHVGDKVVLEGIESLRNDVEIKPQFVEPGSVSENASQVRK